VSKVEEKRENSSLRKLRKPGECEREKNFAPFFEFSHTKARKLFSEKTEKTWRKSKRKGSATFLLHLASGGGGGSWGKFTEQKTLRVQAGVPPSGRHQWFYIHI
jgi:hypothetical protein